MIKNRARASVSRVASQRGRASRLGEFHIWTGAFFTSFLVREGDVEAVGS